MSHTHKAHEKERELAAKRVRFETCIRLVLTFVVALTISIEALSSPSPSAIISAVVGVLPFAYSLYRLAISPENRLFAHTVAAKQFKAERDNLELLITECLTIDTPVEDIKTRFESIQQRTNSFDSITRYYSNKAFDKAAGELSVEGKEVSSEDEIDNLLPPGLRLADYQRAIGSQIRTPDAKQNLVEGDSDPIGYA